MQGAEKEIVANYVTTGEVRIIFWPLLDLGQSSHDAAASVYCAGEQDPALFWSLYDLLFADRQTYGGDRDYFINQAASIGADRDGFTTCFDAGEMHMLVSELNDERREDGVFQRPTFDINGQRLFGNVPYDTFAAAIDTALP